MPSDAQVPAEVTARDRMIQLRDHVAYKVRDKDFDMRYWHCGTSACLGGWVENLFFDGKNTSSDVVGAKVGLDDEQSWKLFYPTGVSLASITRDCAVAVLDNYLATGEIDWSVAR